MLLRFASPDARQGHRPDGAAHCVGIGEQLQARGHRAVFIIEESFEAIDGLLADGGLRERMATNARRLRLNPGTVRAADLIERL